MKTIKLSTLFVLLLSLLLAVGVATRDVLATPADQGFETPASTTRRQASLLFIENVGQFDPGARFQMRGAVGGTLWLADDALWITLLEQPDKETGSQGDKEPFSPSPHSPISQPPHPRRVVNLKLSFPGANPYPRLEPFNRLETVFNYYHGNDPARRYTGVPVWGGVRYVDLYPGVDLEITGQGSHWTWRLVCRTDCQSILQSARLRVQGADTVEALPLAGGEGGLHLVTAVGDVFLPLLTAEGITPDGQPATHNMEPGTYDVIFPFASTPRSLEPPILRLGSVQVSNLQSPTSNLQPPISNPQSAQDNPDDLLFSTFLGADNDDKAYGLAVNNAGEAYVTGYTLSPGFPTTPGAYDTSFDGDSEIFVTRLNADGGDLLYSTFLGGTAVMTQTVSETGWDIALDADGAAYIAGESNSDDFPTTPGAYSTTYIPANPDDVFPGSPPSHDLVIVKLDASGTLVYGTYFAPTLGNGMGIAIDGTGVYVAGEVAASDFPTTEGAYNRSFGYSPDFFVLKLNPAGQGQNDLLYSTYVAMGATPMEPGAYETFGGMAVADGVVYVVGSTTGNFPTTPGAYDPTFNGTHCVGGGICPENAVFFKLNPAGNGAADLLYSTYLGGTAALGERGEAIAVDASGMVAIVGGTGVEDFPTTPGAFDTSYNGGIQDYFISLLDPAGNGAADLLYSTYLGGTGVEMFFDSPAIAMNGSGDIYAAGNTLSLDFPVTPGAYQSTYHGFFVTRLRPQGNGAADLTYSTNFGGQGTEYTGGIALGQGETVYVSGYTNASDFPTTAGAYDTTFGGGTCGSSACDDAFVARLSVCVLTADFDTDGDVDIAEIMQIARRFGATPGDGLYEAQYDLDGDEDIDVDDVMLAASEWRLCSR